MKVDTPRPLLPAERAVLELILSADFAGASELRQQLATVRVVGRCDCGCPTVDLAVAADAVPAPVGARVLPSELEVGPDADGLPGQVIVFADGGRLSGLEYVYFGEPPKEWPVLARLRLVGGPA